MSDGRVKPQLFKKVTTITANLCQTVELSRNFLKKVTTITAGLSMELLVVAWLRGGVKQ